MELTVAHRSEIGPVRPNNEDVIAFWQPNDDEERCQRGALALIADGVGGHGHGEVAARLAADTALHAFRTYKLGASFNALLWHAVSTANTAVYDEGTTKSSSEGRMQTTMTAVVFRNDQIGIAHVGDCRAYLIHSGIVKCLTTDHTFVAFHERMGLGSGLSASSPLRGGLTRSLGKDPIVTIDFIYAEVHAGDYVVLCCDGVHIYITDGELAEIVTHEPPEKACETILDLCKKRGTEDNISIQICRIDRVRHLNYIRGIPIYPVYREEPPMGHEIEVGDVLDDRFEITSVISRSGMASIFKAKDRESGQDVALKVPFMQYESDPAFFSRFQREEEIGLALDHPYILKIIPVDAKKKSHPYIAMELLHGKTLDQVMREERPMSVSKAMALAAKVCDALDHMHQKGIVHRDLKPANIMLCDDGTIRIIDFGIAKAAGMRRVTFTGFSPAMGTPDYMAPEQVKGRRGDQRTDIYSLGAILYEMVTGKTPFDAQNPFMIMQARITGDPEAPTNFNRDITNQFEEIILHAMEREPRNRYASAKDMANELRNSDQVMLTGRVERLQAPKLGYARWRSIKPWLALALIPALVAIVAFLVSRSQR